MSRFGLILRQLRQAPEPPRAADPALVEALRERLKAVSAARFGRMLSIRHVAAGSCNGCELELRATRNMIYDLGQYGLQFVTSPRHADVLLITGVAARNMREAVLETREAMPPPALVIALGDCAVDGGVFKGSPAITGGIDSILPVDLLIAGCPPAPARIVEALLALLQASTDIRLD
jgi:Ni,Fe-hydrogenase III small subunit